MFRCLIPALVLLVACEPEAEPKKRKGAACDSTPIEAVTPIDGATGVFVWDGIDPITVAFAEEPELVDIEVRDPKFGSPQPGSVWQDDDGLWHWSPNMLLGSDVPWEIHVKSAAKCDFEHVATFRTGTWSSVHVDDLQGGVYGLDLSQAEFHGASSSLMSVFGQMHQVFELIWLRDGDVTWITLEENGDQSCLATLSTPAEWVGPVVDTTVTAPIYDGLAWLVEAKVTALAGPDGLERISVDGQMDMAQFGGCALLEPFGVFCEPCADGIGETCVPFHVTEARAMPWSEPVVYQPADVCEI